VRTVVIFVLVDLVLSGTIALVAMNNGQDDWFGL
jgi:hypothetical protein